MGETKLYKRLKLAEEKRKRNKKELIQAPGELD